MNYVPLEGLRPSTALAGATKIPISQRPSAWILPQDNAGAEMTLPFFYFKNFLDATSSQDLQDMGTLYFTSYSPLRSANGIVGTGVDVTVYAWATDVCVTGPTVKLAVQTQDEYSTDGIISTPASAIATVAGKLTDVPFIGPFAMATQIGAGAVSSIAKLFGYTNVPVIDDAKPFKSLVFQGLASAEISSPVEKLTLDPKNELCIDPRTVGLGPIDELSISYLVTKPSFLTSFDWLTTQAGGTLMFNSQVCPLMHKRDSAPYGTLSNYTPMGYLQYLFRHWRGDIIFTFKFIKTKFHKGRVRITWDPLGDLFTNSVSTSVAFTQIVDIGETDEIDIKIPYLQAASWLETWPDSQTARWQTSGFSNQYNARSNGTLTLRVLNALTAPVATGDVSIIVSVRGGDNLEFANPKNPPQFSPFAVQSADEYNAKPKMSVTASRIDPPPDPNRYKINMGENIVSLRTLLRRSTLAGRFPFDNGNIDNTVACSQVQTRVPLTYGYDPNGFNNAVGLVAGPSHPFNFVPVTPYSWIAPLFIGYRGSMIWHYNIDQGGNTNSICTARVRRRYGTFVAQQRNTISILPRAGGTYDDLMRLCVAGNNVYEDNNIITASSGGVSQTNQLTQAGLSILAPMYSPFRFNFSYPTNANYGVASDHSDTENLSLEIMYDARVSGGYPYATVAEKYSSIGTDFNFFFFLNVPTMYNYTTTPLAVIPP